MKRHVSHIICLILASVASLVYAKPFTGQWDWDEAPSSRAFSLKLIQNGTILSGQYCAVAGNGNRVDCDDEEIQNITGSIDNSGKSAAIDFYSFFDARGGKASLSLKNNHLVWLIIKNPQGEFYAPQKAILMRHKSKKNAK